MILPRITLALCYKESANLDAIQKLQVIAVDKRLYLSRKNREALDQLDHALSQGVVEPSTFLERACVLTHIQQPYLALDDFALAKPVLGKSAKGLTCFGKCQLETGDADAAKAAFEKALIQDPEYAKAWHHLAHLAMEQADYPNAIKGFTWLANHSPEDKTYYKQLALAQARNR